MNLWDVRLHRSWRLPAGHVRLPNGVPEEAVMLRLGSILAEATQAEPGPAGEVHLAADLWERLMVPYESIQLRLRRTAAGELELGPAIAVLYPGKESISRGEAEERASLYYGHLQGSPGLLALGFDEEFDWEQGSIFGYVLDNRPGSEGGVVRKRFPIPAVVRLTWSIQRGVITQLREVTENRTFNWVRSIAKWRFHTLLSSQDTLRKHLPETRVLRGLPDLAAMLIRHEMVFVKHDHGIKGRNAVRIRQTEDGFDVTHIGRGAQVDRSFTSLDDLLPALRAVTGTGRCVVQQAIPITGLHGRALHFRIVTVRKPEVGWRLAAATACVAQDDESIFTNLANGARDEALLESLREHHGMDPVEAQGCAERMIDLCLAASAVLEEEFRPLGILGFDLVVASGSHQIWLLEANAVPGWGYSPEIESDLARSQIDLARSLTGF